MGLPQVGEDDYIGWYQLSLGELFRYVWVIDTKYFFTLDSALMIASKGGLDVNMLNRMGVLTKMNYLNSLQDILKAMYGKSSSDSSEMDIQN